MVSLEALSAYLIPLRANPLTNFFLDFLNDIPGLSAPVLNPSDTDSVVCNLLIYVQQNDVVSATALYQKFTTRRVRSDPEWIHNDFLLFALVCTVSKFRLDSQWVRQVLLCRPNTDVMQRLINKSFENLLAGDYNASEDYHQISVVFQIVTQQIQPNDTRLNQMFACFSCPMAHFISILRVRFLKYNFIKGNSCYL